MKRFFSIILSAFLMFSSNSVAFAYEYDFSTDLEKFTANVSNMITDNLASSYDNGGNVLSGTPETYFSDGKASSTEEKYTTAQITNRLIVKSSESIDTLNAIDCVSGYNDLYVLQFADSGDFLSAYEYYSELECVEFLQEDLYYNIQTTDETTEAVTESVTDTSGNEGSDIVEIYNPTQTQSDIFGFTALKAHIADENILYSETIEVAVLDTGVANTHPIFENRIEPTGFNSIDSDDDCFDDYGHGTHVAGIIAANTPGNVVIKPYKVLDNTGKGTDLQVYLGIEQAIADGVDIINMSLSRRGYSSVLYEAITHAEEQGVVVVASAGNNGVSLTEITYSPADFEEVITVASCTDDFQFSDFSNYGGQTDIAAPGNDINSASIDGGYTVKSGTSMSAGFVSAAVSYLLLTFPDYTRSELEEALYYNSKPCLSARYGINYIYVEYINTEKEASITPVFSYTKSLFSDPFELMISCEDENAEIYYRTSMMTEGEYQLYTAPIEINHDLTVHAFTISAGAVRSSVLGYSYTRRPPTDTSVFTVDSDGVLTAYTGTDTNVVLPNLVNGVRIKSVASDVFKGNAEIESIALPAYATTIPDNAFEDCTNLEFVRIKAVTSVGAYAFKGCTSLVSVVSEKLTSVGDYAFYNCNNLRTFVFTLLSDIGESAFENTSSLEVIGTNSFSNISSRAFCNSSLAEISLNNATSIGNEAFMGCENLKSISAPRLTEIKDSAFSGCTNLISIEIDALPELTKDVFEGADFIEIFSANSIKTIPDNIFYNCTKLEDISFENAEYIGANAFRYTAIISAVFDHVAFIGDCAFDGCTELNEISFNTVEAFDFEQFFDSSELKSISFENATSFSYDDSTEFPGLAYYFPLLESFSMPLLEDVPDNMFKNSSLSDLTFNNLKKVGKYAFCNADILSVDLGNTAEIGEYAFYNTDIFTEVSLPAATYIGAYAFAECDNLISFKADLVEAFDLDIINNSGELLEELSLNSAVNITKTGDIDFTYSVYPELKSFSANSLTELQDSAFKGCKNIADINISSVVEIGTECFRGCLRLTEVNLPSVKSIGDLAFYGCTNITDFSADAMKEFDLNILFGCVKLKSLSVDGAVVLNGLEFSDINTLENLWPVLNSFSADSLADIPQYMFYNFINIQNISLNSAIAIPDNTFTGCGIVSADFPAAGSVSDMAFEGCSALETVELNNVTTIGKDIFNGCTAIKILNMNKLEEVPLYADYSYCFTDLVNLESVSMNSLKVASNNMFENCCSLTDISMNSIEVIPDYCFYCCSALTSISMNSVTDIGSHSFSYTKLSQTSFDSLERIGNYAFYQCRNLTSFDFSSLESIGNHAFSYSGLTEIVMDSPTALGLSVFSGCTSIKTFSFYNMPVLSADMLFGSTTLSSSSNIRNFYWGGAKEIPASFFANCIYLQNVELYDAEIIGEKAFYNCKALTSVYIPKLKIINDYAFYNCKALDVGSILKVVEELGAYSITNTANISENTFYTISFDNLKIANENSFDGVYFDYAKFPVIEEIYDLPETNDYILIGSVVTDISSCDDVSSEVIAMEGTPVLEYADEYGLDWLPYNSENAITSNIQEFMYSNSSTYLLNFECIGFDLKYQVYGADNKDLSDAKTINFGSASNGITLSKYLGVNKYVYIVAISTENGKSTEIRSNVVKLVDLFINPVNDNCSINDDFIFTDKNNVTDVYKLINVDKDMEVVTTPSFSSEDTEYFGTGSVITLKFNGKNAYTFKEVLYGDVTGDAVIDVIDAACFHNMCIENDFTDGYDENNCYLRASDLNEDYDLNTSDYQLLVNKILSQ